jgi:pyruvate/2-oxoacid:ferredoxin oxidoreductase beta subunit
MFREALSYPGFAFVHVLAGCVTYQTPDYAETIYQRCDLLPESHDPTDFNRAVEVARGSRFALGILYRRPPEQAPAVVGEELAGQAGVWPPIGATSASAFPGED